MNVVCLDLEGVLIPEIWIAVAKKSGIDELRITTRDTPDYDQLMRRRLEILRRNGLTLAHIQTIIKETVQPLDGALDFMMLLRRRCQLLILSDTFVQFFEPLMASLTWPTILCNRLIVDADGRIADWRLRQPDGKRRAVEALRSIGCSVAAAGDSYNDLGMIDAADRGALFSPPDEITTQLSRLPIYTDYDRLALFLLEGKE